MDEKATPAASGVKLILVSAGAIIVLLIVMKELNFIPSEASAGPVGVKFQTLVPPQQQATPKSTEELERKVRELQESLQNANARSAAPVSASPASSAPANDPPPASVEVAGFWQANPYRVQIAQLNNQIGLTLYYPTGIPGAVCQGTLNGRSLQLGCTNGMISSTATGQVVNNNRIELTDTSQGYQQQWVLVR